MGTDTEIVDAFPQLEEITDDNLRETVIEMWASALEDSEFESLDEVPWAPHNEDILGAQYQVPHIRDVVEYAIALVDTFTAQRAVSVDRNAVIAGALLHDISKFYEYSKDGHTELWDLIQHPNYGVHLAADAGVSMELQHIIISHTSSSAVEPKTPEAVIVALADEMASESVFIEATGHVRTLADE